MYFEHTKGVFRRAAVPAAEPRCRHVRGRGEMRTELRREGGRSGDVWWVNRQLGEWAG